MRKSYILAIILFVLAMIFNKPEDAVNGVAMFLFLGAIISGFIGFIRECEADSTNYRV